MRRLGSIGHPLGGRRRQWARVLNFSGAFTIVITRGLSGFVLAVLFSILVLISRRADIALLAMTSLTAASTFLPSCQQPATQMSDPSYEHD